MNLKSERFWINLINKKSNPSMKIKSRRSKSSKTQIKFKEEATPASRPAKSKTRSGIVKQSEQQADQKEPQGTKGATSKGKVIQASRQT